VVKRDFPCTRFTASCNVLQSIGTRTEFAVAVVAVAGKETGEVVFDSPAADDADDGCTATTPTIETTKQSKRSKQSKENETNETKSEWKKKQPETKEKKQKKTCLCCLCFGRRCDLMDVTTTSRTPITTPAVVEGDLFFGQGGDQLNGGRRGTVDFQPVPTVSFPTISMHRRLGPDQCDGGTIGCKHSTPSTVPHFHVGTSADDASTIRRYTRQTTMFHKDIVHRKRGQSRHSNPLSLTQCQVLQMTISLNPSLELNTTHDPYLLFWHFWITHNVHGRRNHQRVTVTAFSIFVHCHNMFPFPQNNGGQTRFPVHPVHRFLQRVAIYRHPY